MSTTIRLTARSAAVALAALLALAFVAAPSQAQSADDLPLDELPVPPEEGEEPGEGEPGEEPGEGDPGEGDLGFGEPEDGEEEPEEGFDGGDDELGGDEAQVTEVPEGGVAAGGGGSAIPTVALAAGLLLAMIGTYAVVAVRRPALLPLRR